MVVPAASFGRTAIVRLVPLAVLALVVWVVSQNVSWRDTLVIGETRLEGTIEGDWRADAVGFRVDAGQELPEGATLDRDGVLAAAAARGATLRVSETTLSQGGEALAFPAPAPELHWNPGIPRALERLGALDLALALAILLAASVAVVTRWWRLLQLEGCDVGWATAFRFTYIGLFFNSFIPGISGGDVARAVAVVRDQPENRASALMTVVIDRVLGLVAMVLMATVAVWVAGERLATLRWPVTLFTGAMLLGLLAFVNSSLRRVARVDAWLPRLPFGDRIARIDGAARRLLSHPREVSIALALSVLNHLGNAACVIIAARTLGSRLGIDDWIAVMTISNTLAAAPISPGGLGVVEALFGSLSRLLGGSYVVGVATGIVYRLALLALAGAGGLIIVLGGARLRARVREARRSALPGSPAASPNATIRPRG